MAQKNDLKIQYQALVLESLIDRELTLIQGNNKTTRKYVLPILLNAYNRYQEDERDGVDYIFNINKREDSACVINGGMSIEELYNLQLKCRAEATNYYMFGHNHETAELITINGIANTIKAVSSDMAKCIIKYRDIEEYDRLYTFFEEELKDHKTYTWICLCEDGAKSNYSQSVFNSISECYDDIMREVNGKISYYFKGKELGFDSDRDVYETHIENYMNKVVLKTYGRAQFASSLGTYEYHIIEIDGYKTMLIENLKGILSECCQDKYKSQSPIKCFNFNVGFGYATTIPLTWGGKNKAQLILSKLTTDGDSVMVGVKREVGAAEMEKDISLFDDEDIETIICEISRVNGLPVKFKREYI